MFGRDPYYKSPDGYDAYQWRELIKREIKNGKVYSTYKCSNLGGEVDIFTTVFPEQKPPVDKLLDGIEDACDSIIIMALVFIIMGFSIIGFFTVLICYFQNKGGIL